MNDNVKIRLKRGDQEIEIEGTRVNVDELLAKWWNESTPPAMRLPAVLKSKRNSTARQAKTERELNVSDKDNVAFNPVSVSNGLKQDARYQLMEKKILHVKAQHWYKAALVLWFTNQSLTSGEIFATLKQLRCKTSLPRISEALDEHSGELLHDGTRQVGTAARYCLTGAAHREFEDWLTATTPKHASPSAA